GASDGGGGPAGKEKGAGGRPGGAVGEPPCRPLGAPAEKDPADGSGHSACSYSGYFVRCYSGGATLVLAAQSGDDQVLPFELVGRNGAEDSDALRSAGREVGRSSDHP